MATAARMERILARSFSSGRPVGRARGIELLGLLLAR
jgi:hypothetical protein